jgi:hypothetical protein
MQLRLLRAYWVCGATFDSLMLSRQKKWNNLDETNYRGNFNLTAAISVLFDKLDF